MKHLLYILALLPGLLFAGDYVPMMINSNTGAMLPAVADVIRTNLFAGPGTTGLVTSAAGDDGNFLKADGTWGTPAGGAGGGDVYRASNNTYAAGTTQRLDSLIVSNPVVRFHTNGPNGVGFESVLLPAGSGAVTNSTWFGDGALYGAAGITRTTAIGRSAGRGYTSSGEGYSAFVGDNAGFNCTGNRHVGVGPLALSEYAGTYGTALGAYAGYDADGLRICALGYLALYGVKGDYNTACGADAANAAANGSGITAIGNNALGAALKSDYCTMVGYAAGRASGSGDARNTCVGYSSFYYSKGYYNTALGYESLYLYPGYTGTHTTVVGYRAGKNAYGTYNSSVGYETLLNCSNADNNAVVGTSALTQSPGASKNAGVGHGVLYYAGAATGNTAVGYLSMENTTSQFSTAVGYFAGNRLSGVSNTIIGAFGSGTYLTSTNSTNMTVIGANAPYRGNDSVSIGSPSQTFYINCPAVAENVVHIKTNTTVTAPPSGYGGIYVDANTNYMFWHASGVWTNKLW